jgi:probable HAF family extracellular repeat protein
VLWRDGRIVDLGALAGNPTFAYAINDRGQIVGTSTTPTGELRGFLWENGRMRDLGIDGGVIPRDINNQGQVVGSLDFGEGGARQHAFSWRDGVVTRLAAPGIASSAEAVNDRGAIVGRYIIDIEQGSRPVRWYRGELTELGLLARGDAGGALAINDQGQILGTSNIAPHSLAEHPFVWWQGRQRDLTPAGVPAEAAYALADINNLGQIVAGGTLFTPAGA